MNHKSDNKHIKKDVKIGALLSYFLIFLNATYSLFITPFILRFLGSGEYGVYKTIASLSSSLMILDLGLGGTITRYLAKYKAEGKDDKIPGFISTSIKIGIILICIICVVCSIIFFNIQNIYQNGLTETEIQIGKSLFFVLSINMVLHIFENILNGIICGYNKFSFANGLKLLRIILRIGITLFALPLFNSSIVLVSIDLLLTTLLILFELFYCKVFLKVKTKVFGTSIDKKVFKESLIYTLLLFLTSIAAQINTNLDNVVIGAIIGAEAVTVYSISLLIFSMFENISTAISGVMLPTIVNSLQEDPSGKDSLKIVTRTGRIQFMLLSAVFIGFVFFGAEFVFLWMGEGFDDVYFLAIILMAPAILELCINVCLSILRAKNKLGFRTMVLFASTIINATVTIVGTYLFGYYAAAIGTAISFFFGSVITMGLYYYKCLKINVLKLYYNIFHKTFLCVVLSGFLSFAISLFLGNSWSFFLLKILIFITLYGISLLIFGFTKDEKKNLPLIRKFYK